MNLVRCGLLFLLISLSGCLPQSHHHSDTVDKPDVPAVKATAADVWQALVDAVDAGTIVTEKELAQYGKGLLENGVISHGDAEYFDQMFPGFTTSESDLNKKAVLIKLQKMSDAAK